MPHYYGKLAIVLFHSNSETKYVKDENLLPKMRENFYEKDFLPGAGGII